jgi:glycosyltransferase involved in cell wall biosynthesis
VKVWLYCLIYNEEILLPYFLRHYGPMVDRLIFFDMDSTDYSREIISTCPLAEIRRPPFEAIDDKAVADFSSNAYREARGQADWVVWVDCDEFIHPVVSLREKLADRLGHGVQALAADGYQMVADAPPSGDGQLTEAVRRGFRDVIWDKVCVFDPAIDLHWRPGRHEATISREAEVEKSAVKLLHYRYLGDEYLRARNARNFNRMTLENIASGRGYQVYPDYRSGRYSLSWFQKMKALAVDVVGEIAETAR